LEKPRPLSPIRDGSSIPELERIGLRESGNIKASKKNMAAERAEPRRIKQFRMAVAVFCGLLVRQESLADPTS
jgi:hypothetical protein